MSTKKETIPSSENELPEDIAALLPPHTPENARETLTDERIINDIRSIDDAAFWSEENLARLLTGKRDLPAVLALGFLGEISDIQEKARASLGDAPAQARLDDLKESELLAMEISAFRTEVERKKDILSELSPSSKKYKETAHELLNDFIDVLAQIQRLKKNLLHDSAISAKSIVTKGLALRAGFLLAQGKNPAEFWFGQQKSLIELPKNALAERSSYDAPKPEEQAADSFKRARVTEYFSPHAELTEDELKAIEAWLRHNTSGWTMQSGGFQHLARHDQVTYYDYGAFFSILEKFYLRGDLRSRQIMGPAKDFITDYLYAQEAEFYDSINSLDATDATEAEKKHYRREMMIEVAAAAHAILAINPNELYESDVAAAYEKIANDFLESFYYESGDSEDDNPSLDPAAQALIFLKLWSPKKFEELASRNPFPPLLVEWLKENFEQNRRAGRHDKTAIAGYYLAMLTADKITIHDDEIVTRGKEE